jgi:hypothetical protein
MAPRADWKGFLRLSLVTCPVALYPATSESEKISFNQLNPNTGHPIKYLKVDADTGKEVPNEDIVKGNSRQRPIIAGISLQRREAMSQDSVATVENFWREVWKQPQNPDAIDRLVHEDFVITSGGQDVVGRARRSRWRP